MKQILVGQNIPRKCRDSLEKMGYNTVLLPPFSRLQKGVSTHADMLVFKGKNGLFVHVDYYLENKELFDSLGVKIIKSDENIDSDYPHDILFNAVVSGDTLFSNTDYTSKFIKAETKTHIRVKQGYTACSTCRVTENAFITADEGLYNAYRQNGVDALLIEKGHVLLPFYDCGFIGGASVRLENTLCFFGKIEDHPSYCSMVNFAKKYKIELKSLSDEALVDIGGGILNNLPL